MGKKVITHTKKEKWKIYSRKWAWQFFTRGKLYEPGIRNSIQRVFVERGSNYDLREGIAFANPQKVLSSCRKELTKIDKGNKPNAARAITA